jgi:hypothetical protein
LGLGVLFAWLHGCTSRIKIEAPLPVRPGDKAIVLAVIQGAKVELYAMNARGEPPVAEPLQAARAELYALLYPNTLAELRLAAGRQAAAVGVEPVALPRFQAAFFATAGDRLDDWTEVTAVPEAISSFPLSPPDYEGCAAAGGCFVEERDEGVCSKPCPDPASPVEPRRPMAAPAEAAVPVLTPCPSGWAQIEAAPSGQTACEPSVGTANSTCSQGQAQFHGEAACAEIGDPCGGDEWSTVISAPATAIYVSASAPISGADGSRARPFGTIARGLQAAAPGAIVAVGKGRFAEAIEIGPGVTVLGACAAETSIDGPPAMIAATAHGAGARLMNISIHAAGSPISLREAGASLALEGVLVEGGSDAGWSVVGGASSTGTEVVIRGTSNAGLSAGAGARITAERLVIEHVRGAAVYAESSSTTVTIRAAAIREPTSDRRQGVGVAVASGAHVEIDGLLVAGAMGRGLEVADGATARIANARIEATRPDLGSPVAYGAIVSRGAKLDLSSSVLERNTARGVLVDRPGASATLTNVIVRDTPAISTSTIAPEDIGVTVANGAFLSMHRALLSGNHGAAFMIGGAGAKAILEDVAILDTEPSAMDRFGAAIVAAESSDLTVSRLLIDGASSYGLRGVGTAGAPAAIHASDLVVRNVGREPATQLLGFGVNMDHGTLVASRVHVELTAASALYLTASTASVTDLRAKGPSRLTGALAPDQAAVTALTGCSIVLGTAAIDRGSGDGFLLKASTATISDASLRGSGEAGADIRVVAASLVAERIDIDESIPLHGQGIAIGDGHVIFRDLAVRGGDQSGAWVDFGSEALIERASFRDLQKAALQTGPTAANAKVVASDVKIVNVRSGGDESGAGISAQSGRIDVRRFSISDIVEFGTFVGLGATLRLRDGAVENSDVGVKIEGRSYDPTLVLDHVRYRSEKQILLYK